MFAGCARSKSLTAPSLGHPRSTSSGRLRLPLWARPGGWRSTHARILPANLVMAETVEQMGVHHAGGLHVGVADGGADELEAARLEILAQGVGLRRAGGDVLGRFL